MSAVPRLSNESLSALSQDVRTPQYDRNAVSNGVVHLGIGAFHRAHQAVMYDDAMAAGDLRWGVTGVTMRSADVYEQLAPQDGLYVVSVRDGRNVFDRVVGAVRQVLVAPDNPQAVVSALSSPHAHLVTLTVTEKGYKLDPASGELNGDDPDVASDLIDLARPRTAIGLVVAASARRRELGLPALTAISCDNLPRNGARLRNAVLALARGSDPRLADWIEANGAFPETMVDRIVPATTPDDIDALAGRAGVRDLGLVKTEPFTQWVIENRFAGERPDFSALGAQLTDDVAPWESAKLRLLNGAHSAMAYLGGLAGRTFVHDFVATEAGRAFVRRLWDEAESTLTPPPGLDVAQYRDALMARFCNEALQHRLQQIAMDGSQKLPQRLFATIAARLAKQQSIDAMSLAVASWIRWIEGRDDAGVAIKLDDPMATTLKQAVKNAGGDARACASAVLGISAIVDPSLAADLRLINAVSRNLELLRRHGAVAALQSLARSDP